MCIPRHGPHLKNALYKDIVQYKAKVYTTPFINAVKFPIAV